MRRSEEKKEVWPCLGMRRDSILSSHPACRLGTTHESTATLLDSPLLFNKSPEVSLANRHLENGADSKIWQSKLELQMDFDQIANFKDQERKTCTSTLLTDIKSAKRKANRLNHVIDQNETHNEDVIQSQYVFEEDASDDGYNWRKYGQKHVKGSKYPRSYYRCTYSDCQVKKKIDHALDGQIIRIVYEGNHSHQKPDPIGQHDFRSSSEVKEVPSSSVVTKYSHFPTLGFQDGITPNGNNYESKGKKRKKENYFVESIASSQAFRHQQKVVVQTVSNVDILDDGYRWRKYGQKLVKENTNPRSYYKCTTPGCTVRKHIERAADDIKSVITSYEGKHNHEPPSTRNSNITNAFSDGKTKFSLALDSLIPFSPSESTISEPETNNFIIPHLGNNSGQISPQSTFEPQTLALPWYQLLLHQSPLPVNGFRLSNFHAEIQQVIPIPNLAPEFSSPYYPTVAMSDCALSCLSSTTTELQRIVGNHREKVASYHSPESPMFECTVSGSTSITSELHSIFENPKEEKGLYHSPDGTLCSYAQFSPPLSSLLDDESLHAEHAIGRY
ncbi:uncharacterized protein A4U43_C09F8670 [Asparagus officinalis]|uniref:WRKY domain-containing protein n=1 Tax=Asparagus officinalis TaxID=4686 RepID=A0A5P1E681_ASPOF|nr:uncharacterized protein A4U43_C09F8670 [Asparagus officinalis]